jgi:hypothetical protein
VASCPSPLPECLALKAQQQAGQARQSDQSNARGANNRLGFRKLDGKRVAEALRESGGVLLAAAGILGCDRHTLSKWLGENPQVEEHVQRAKLEVTDLARVKHIQAIRNGDPWAVQMELRVNGGYSERHIVSGDPERPLKVDVELDVGRFALAALEKFESAAALLQGAGGSQEPSGSEGGPEGTLPA